MTFRIPLALGIALVLAQPAFAQIPPERPPEQTRPVEIDPASMVPAEWTMDQAAPVSGERYWATFDGLAGWISGANVPPLLTISTPKTPQANAGILGLQSTTIVNPSRVNEDERCGTRLTAGLWLNCDHTFGFEAGFMMLESEANIVSLTSDSLNPILARPYVDANTNKEQAVLLAFPGLANGSGEVRASSGNLYEVHLDFTENFINCCGWRVDSILGYRFYHYDEGLRVRQAILPTNPNFVPGTVIAAQDNFSAQNQFHGCDIGFKTSYCWCDWTLGLLAKAAAGCVNQEVDISGNTVTTVPGVAPVVNNGGILALQSNIGTHRSHDWVVLPEFGGNLSWQMSCNVRLHAGYSILFLDRIARAADQIDLTVNPNLFPPVGANPAGPSRPAFSLERSDIWMQNISFGVEINF
ncbi:MAG TPA: BBP7 family outer membrane beta-barrel protein [Gemmataceae bacterium]|nr:BBP7 family outer membrane beta-barrel protein [Gemmataceae bacterium]